MMKARRTKMAKNNKKRKVPSFFDQQLQQFGPGWIYRMNTDQIRKNAMKVFRDLAFGNLDPYEVQEYFAVVDFTYNLKVAADDNAKYNYYSYLGLSYCPDIDIAMQRVASTHYEAYMAFSVTATLLNNILTDISTSNGAFIPSLLMEAMATLNPYKHFFNGYFITLPRNDDTRVRVPRREIGGNQYHEQGYNNPGERNFWGEPDQSSM